MERAVALTTAPLERAQALVWLARLQGALPGRMDDAAHTWATAVAALEGLTSPHHPDTVAALERGAAYLGANGQPELAAGWRRRARLSGDEAPPSSAR